jgi:acylphosphatase
MKKSVHMKITGLVQGVFFRQNTKQKAQELGINGWVRNCEDGSVEVEAEGDETMLKVFIQWCHRGPQRAVVKKVEQEEIQGKGYVEFEIRR